MESQRLRFDLLRTAQSLLWDPGLVNSDKQHQTCWCHRTTYNAAGKAPIHRAVDGSSARLGGVTTCGLVWTCPVCCAKVAETRRRELSRAMDRHVKAGGFAYLLTFTFPHDVTDRLAELLERLDKARQKFQNSRKWKAWKTEAERVGGVTSMEVTLGHNGWHPHLHMLCFTKANAFGEGEPINAHGDLWSVMIGELASLWVDCLVKVGLCDRSQLTDAMKHSFNVRGGAKAAEYIAKYGRDERWGQSAELTKSHAKTAGKRVAPKTWHHTPFQLLQLIRDGAADFIPAWREYVDAFKGKRMLTWTPGLKAHFDIAELDDEDLAAEGVAPKADEVWVATLSHEQFVMVTACAKLGALLQFVAIHGAIENAQSQVDAWVAMECRRAVASGDVRRRFGDSNRFTTLPPT